MAIEMESPENFDQGGNRLDVAGKYHMAVLNVDENPTNDDDQMIDNAVFRASCCVLDGTEQGQKNKGAEFLFFGPKMTHKDHGEMARKKIFFFANSIGCAVVAGGKMTLDFAQAAGRQFVADIEISESEKNGRKFRNPNIRFCNVYHVDDPAVKDVPKDQAALGLLPATLRKKPEDFAKKPTQAASGTKIAAPQPKPADKVSLDDL